MNYTLRCIAPVCIEDEARWFDERMMTASMDKLGLDDAERTERTTALLQRRLRDGGWGLTAAARTSPAAYLGSLAACHTEPVFAAYCNTATPLPSSSLLYGWIDGSLQRVRQAGTGDTYPAAVEPLLPATTGGFFAHYAAADPTTTSTLQHALNAKAADSNTGAAVGRMKAKSRQGDKREWAHHKAIAADGAWCWKTV